MSIDAERYEQDFYRWTREQAAVLKARQRNALDLANLVEEITALGVSEKRALGSHLKNLVTHLLEWQHQPTSGRRSLHRGDPATLPVMPVS